MWCHERITQTAHKRTLQPITCDSGIPKTYHYLSQLSEGIRQDYIRSDCDFFQSPMQHSVRDLSTPPPRFTSLLAYSTLQRIGDTGWSLIHALPNAVSIPFFTANRTRSEFCRGLCGLGISYSNLREPGLASENLKKAYDLRDKVSERERFGSRPPTTFLVTGELKKAIQTYTLWAKSYLRSSEPFGNLGVDYTYLGQYENGVEASLEDLRLNPGSAAAYTNLVGLYAALQRLDRAKKSTLQPSPTRLIIPSSMGIVMALPFSRTTIPGCSNKLQPPPPARRGRTSFLCFRYGSVPRSSRIVTRTIQARGQLRAAQRFTGNGGSVADESRPA